MKTLTWQNPGQHFVAQELIKIIINHVAELRKEIGICINSLEELDGKLEKLTVDDYFKMKSRVIEISNLLSVGYFFTKALDEAVKFLTKSDVADEGRN